MSMYKKFSSPIFCPLSLPLYLSLLTHKLLLTVEKKWWKITYMIFMWLYHWVQGILTMWLNHRQLFWIRTFFFSTVELGQSCKKLITDVSNPGHHNSLALIVYAIWRKAHATLYFKLVLEVPFPVSH